MEGSRFDKRTGEHRAGCVYESVRAALVLLALAGVAVGSMAPATVPPSAYEGGLINTPNPIDRSANLPITGNVAGGRHFRGPIPYDSTTSFGAPLGSTTLDSFRRYSTVPQGMNGYPHNYSPFYSPSGSVSTLIPGQAGVFAPGSPRIAGGVPQYRTNQMVDSLPMVEVPQSPMPAESGIGVSPRLRYWPMSPGADEMKDIVSDEWGDQLATRPPTQPPDPTMTAEEYQRQLEQLRRDLERVQAGASQLGQNLNAENPAVPPQSPLQQPLPQPPVIQPREGQADDLQTVPPAEVRPELPDPSAGRTLPGNADPDKLPAMQRVEETSRAFDATAKFLKRPGAEQANGPASADRAGRLRNASESAEDITNAAEPNGVPRAPGVSGSITQEQFDHYLAAGESYLRQGRYYRAADAFTLASVYIAHDPRTHLGKSHALLAAGDYVSSAVSLARAIELDARYALRKVNLVETIGGPDAFIQRITNLEESARAGAAPQLQFLLAYVYLQMGYPDEARVAIEAARKGLPASGAVSLLENAIQGIAR